MAFIRETGGAAADNTTVTSTGLTFTLGIAPGVDFALMAVGWEASTTVANPSVTWDGTTMSLVAKASGNTSAFHLGVFQLPHPTITGAVRANFAASVTYISLVRRLFLGTTKVSTVTIVTTTGASTQLGIAVSSGPPFSWVFAAIAGTVTSTAHTFTTAHSSMDSFGIFAGDNYSAYTGVNESSAESLLWNSSAESTFVAVGFALDPEVNLMGVTVPRIVLHFNVILGD